jgi:hypothetical protein
LLLPLSLSRSASESVREARARGETGPAKVTIDKELVRKKLLPMLERSDYSKFIL